MDHRELQSELLAYAEGSASKRIRSRVHKHLEVCGACRTWLQTYRLVAHGLASAGGGGQHPSSDELASLATGRWTGGELEMALAEEHLGSCDACHEVVELSRLAVAQARTGSQHLSPGGRFARLPVVRWAMAAGIAGLLLLGGWALQRGPRSAEALLMAGDRLGSGDHIVQARASIEAVDVSVEQGARVVFQAGRTVAFGDGFSVASGAALSVRVGEGPHRLPRPGAG